MRRFRRGKRAAAVSLLLCLSLAACSPTSAQEARVFAMDTDMSFTVYGTQSDLAALTRTVFDLDARLSVTRPESLVAQLNAVGSIEADNDLIALLDAAKAIGDSTGGALDITLYPVVRAWGFTTGEHHIPDDDTIAALLEKVDYTAIERTDTTVTLPAGMEIDFGALAKGYAGEKCAGLLREAGVTSAILRLSGNIQTVGNRPDGSPWQVGIQDPAGETGELLGILSVTDQAVVTSGGYQRYFEVDGIRYWHIMDPATGGPARSGLVSVTVVSDRGVLADGLSTALFVLGREKALDYYETHGGFEAILVDDTGNVWITPGLQDSFTLSAQRYTPRFVS